LLCRQSLYHSVDFPSQSTVDEVQYNQYSGYIVIEILLSYCQYVYNVVIHSMDSVIY